MTYILIPGRHHMLTTFMHQYFLDVLDGKERLLDGASLLGDNVTLVWAITSSNHSNTRRNPFPGHRREAALELFCEDLPAPSLVHHITDIGMSERFARYIVNSVEVSSRGQVRMTPENTVIATSTPEMIGYFQAEGFHRFLPIEIEALDPFSLKVRRAWEVLTAIVQSGQEWQNSAVYKSEAHKSTKTIIEKYGLMQQLIDVYEDPLGGQEGDLTATRDYEVYRAAFDQGAERKYGLVDRYIVPGRIVDVGCATGSIIKKMSFDPRLHESDLYGVELARPLYVRCVQAKDNGEFGNENVFFYQRNIMQGQLFPTDSVQTTTSFSLTHEIDSYLGRDSLLSFLRRVYEQTAEGGVYLNVDVVGPEEPDKPVLLWLNHEDGSDDDGRTFEHDDQPAYTEYLLGLSTLGRFKRFMKDFRAEEGDGIQPEIVERGGKFYARLRHADASEFMQTKDYVQSWFSEMHERFCFWSLSEWKNQLETAGFSVHPDSHVFVNDWIVENRLKGKVALFEDADGELKELPTPPQTVVLIATK